MTLLGVFWLISFPCLVAVLFYSWPPPMQPPRVEVYPPAATLAPGKSLQFLARVSGADDESITWSATAGIITPAGVFRAPDDLANPTITIMAVRNQDRTHAGSAVVFLRQSQLVMTRSVVDGTGLKPGAPFAFHVNGDAGEEAGVEWSASDGEIKPGTSSYTIPANTGAARAVITARKDDRQASAVVLLKPPPRDDFSREKRMFLIVLMMGAVGASLGSIRSFANFLGNRAFVPSWGFFYLSRPIFGAGLALLVFFAYRIGAFHGPGNSSPADPAAAAFVAGIVGLFADIVLEKLKELVTQLLKPEDTRSDKMADAVAPPVITSASASRATGVVTVNGSGFAEGATVSINGATVATTFISAAQLLAKFDKDNVNVGDQLKVSVANSETSKSGVVEIAVAE
jgi:hypothetical protein